MYRQVEELTLENFQNVIKFTFTVTECMPDADTVILTEC